MGGCGALMDAFWCIVVAAGEGSPSPTYTLPSTLTLPQ
eukprot:COSAG02_NODE_14010_length_1322_cov_1.094031_1_plen_37_part_10